MEKGAGLLSSPGHPPGNLSFLEHVPVAVGWPSPGVNRESRRVPGWPECQQPFLRQVGTCPWPAVLSGPTWAGRTADIIFSAQSLAGSLSNAGCKVSGNNSAIKIWHLVEISIRCFSWEVWRSGCVQSTKRLRQWPRQCWGFTGQTRDCTHSLQNRSWKRGPRSPPPWTISLHNSTRWHCFLTGFGVWWKIFYLGHTSLL